MKRIFVPTPTPSFWQLRLADPRKHWKKGRSAMTEAACWEAAEKQHLPADIDKFLQSTNQPALTDLELLCAFPEWEVKLPGGRTPSCTDVLAITRNEQGLVVIAVEAKVDEDFGPTVQAKREEASEGVEKRLKFLREELDLEDLRGHLRYQLVHRTASALITAEKFHAETALMLVHAFAHNPQRREDFDGFCTELCAKKVCDGVFAVPRCDRPALFLAWCDGDRRFLEEELPSML